MVTLMTSRANWQFEFKWLYIYSPLLRSVKIKESVEAAFCIGLPDWCICVRVGCSRAREQMDDRDLVPGTETAKRTVEAKTYKRCEHSDSGQEISETLS